MSFEPVLSLFVPQFETFESVSFYTIEATFRDKCYSKRSPHILVENGFHFLCERCEVTMNVNYTY